jgi:hypothetical protein
MKKLFFCAVLVISGAAYAESGKDATSLADCAAVYTLSATVLGDEKTQSATPYQKRAEIAQSYALAASRALQASINLSDEMTAKNKMTEFMLLYNKRIADDKNMNFIVPKLAQCKGLVEQ